MAEHAQRGSSKRKIWLIVGVGALLIAGSGAAYAATTPSSSSSSSSGSGNGASKPSPSPSTTSASPSPSQSSGQGDDKRFTISGAPSGIAPGQTKTYLVTVKNNATSAMRVVTIVGSVAPVSGCDTTKITIASYNANATGATQYKVDALKTAAVPLTISFSNTNTNQDGCKGRTLALSYSGTAEQWH